MVEERDSTVDEECSLVLLLVGLIQPFKAE